MAYFSVQFVSGSFCGICSVGSVGSIGGCSKSERDWDIDKDNESFESPAPNEEGFGGTCGTVLSVLLSTEAAAGNAHGARGARRRDMLAAKRAGGVGMCVGAISDLDALDTCDGLPDGLPDG